MSNEESHPTRVSEAQRRLNAKVAQFHEGVGVTMLTAEQVLDLRAVLEELDLAVFDRDVARAEAAALHEASREDRLAQVLAKAEAAYEAGELEQAALFAIREWVKDGSPPRDSGDGEGAMPGNDTGKGE